MGHNENRFETSNKSYGTKGQAYEPSQAKSSQMGGGGPADKAIEKLKSKLASRGARGFIGMQRQFKIMDDNNSGNIDIYEFKKAVKDFKIDINEQEV